MLLTRYYIEYLDPTRNPQNGYCTIVHHLSNLKAAKAEARRLSSYGICGTITEWAPERTGPALFYFYSTTTRAGRRVPHVK